MLNSSKTALITGITGQDGSFLSELLLKKGYEVFGIIRRSSTPNTSRIEHLLDNPSLHLCYCDLTDSSGICRIIRDIRPDEIYNLAAQSHVGVSFDQPEFTAEVNALGVLRILEAVRTAGLSHKTRIYQASTSELYGKVHEIPQSETTPFHPRSPYGVAKLYAFWIMKHYREAYGMSCSNGILFNHESERRGETFVTRKITKAAARISLGSNEVLTLGNLSAKRDWGYAKDYVECMHKILSHSHPDDFVIATGETKTVREFCTASFERAGIELVWLGEGLDECGIDKATGKTVVKVSPEFFRAAEVDLLLGDPSKAVSELGFNPRKTTFRELVEIMTDADIAKQKAVLEKQGTF